MSFSAITAGCLLKDGRYKIIERIGRGFYSQVYSALDNVSSQLVAIKISFKIALDAVPTQDQEQQNSEYEILKQLKHTGIVQVRFEQIYFKKNFYLWKNSLIEHQGF